MINGTQKTEKEYREVPVDSSSSLKEFSMDRKKYYKKYILNERVDDDESKASIVGRLVDCLLLESEEFDNRFAMSSVGKAPTGNMEKFVNSLYRNRIENEEIEFAEIAKIAYKDSEYKWTLDKVLEKFIGSDAEIYFNEMLEIKRKGLTVVTLDDIQNAEKIVNELKNNPFTSKIIGLETDERYTVQNQVKIEGFEIDELPMKAMMDKVVIDHKNKIIQCYDLKCVWSVENFLEEYYLYRRAYIQAYVYYQACQKIKEDLELEYYTVEYPKFIVVDSINYFNPLIYTTNSKDMIEAYMGFEYKGKTYPGIGNIIKDITWARDNGIWNISRNNYLNNGVVNLKN